MILFWKIPAPFVSVLVWGLGHGVGFCCTCSPHRPGVNASLVWSHWSRNFSSAKDKSFTGHLRGCFGKAVSPGLPKETGDNVEHGGAPPEFSQPPWTGDTSGPTEAPVAEGRLLQSRVLIWFAFFQSVEKNHLEDVCAFLSAVIRMYLHSSRLCLFPWVLQEKLS